MNKNQSANKNPCGVSVVYHTNIEKEGRQIITFFTKFSRKDDAWGKKVGFSTSPEIEAAVAKIESRLKNIYGKTIGMLVYEVNPYKKVIRSVNYWPIRPHDLNAIGLTSMEQASLKKIGLAERLEAEVEEYLGKLHPDYKISSTAKPEEERKRQLKRRGRKTGKPIPIKKAANLTRKKIRKDELKAKMKKVTKRLFQKVLKKHPM